MPTDLPLHPDVRSLYGGSLGPPPGTVFDAGVATTFSLDIETALAVPVTLALFASEDRDELLKSPLALLEGLERTADRLAIFCEAGRIQAQPAPQSRLCTLLERLITEVAAPGGGSFHPKVWVLRYRPLVADEPTRIRLLVLSRNLTRDRSWDMCLSLDGKVVRRRSATNSPLVDFLRRLPSLATGAAPEHVDPLVAELSKDLHRTEWTLPATFEKVEFAVNGTKRRIWRPPDCRRLGVVSPFCDEDTLEMLADLSIEPSVLVSRSDELIAVASRVLDRFSEVSVMDELAETEDGEGDDSDDEAARPLGGLHAKVFVQENGWDTSITVGSGNATRPALLTGRNVEVFATLTGKRSRVGSISDIFGPDGFGRVLRAFRSAEIPQRDAAQHAAEQRIDRARRELVDASLTLDCTAREDEDGGQGLWEVILRPGQSIGLDGLGSASCWPITRGEAHARAALTALCDGNAVEIGTMPLLDVTRYVAFRLADATHEETTTLFALGLRVSGLPTTRHWAVLRWVLDSKDAFLRYLRLLLADTGDPLSAQFAAGSADGGGVWNQGADDEPILEDMVRALSHGQDRLSAVRRLMERLERISDEDAAAVVPEDFARLWNAFREVLDEEDRTHA